MRLRNPFRSLVAEPTRLASSTPPGRHRVLLLAPPGTTAPPQLAQGSEVLVVVPALASKLEAATGAVDDRRAEAQRTADRLGAALSARAEVGADDPVLAVEDSLRVFGADEVVVVGGDGLAERIRERVAIPVTRA